MHANPPIKNMQFFKELIREIISLKNQTEVENTKER